MKILVADDDPISATVLEALLTSSGHECSIVHDGNAAWELAKADDPPRIMFLDWMMPGIDGLELCRKIRQLDRPFYTYIAIISVRNKQRDITLGFQSGADDFITKPYQAEEVLARLRVAERVIRTLSPGMTLQRALEEAVVSDGGDIIVRSGNIVGRIMLHAGEVAWAHVSNEPGSLYAMLSSETSITKEEIRAVLEECTSTGKNFAEVIVEWGLLSGDRLRERMRRWIRGKIATIGRLPEPSMIFSPESRSYSSGLLFDIAEVFPPELLLGPKAAPTADAFDDALASESAALKLTEEKRAEVDASLDRAIAIEGALSAALFDGRTGQCLGARGEAVDLDLAWRNLKLASAADAWDEIEDIIITTRRHLYILRPYSRTPARFLFLATDRAHAKLGMVRLGLADCTSASIRKD
ncbi:MAG: response regulator [Myxococcales bacterium]|nr:response regulator [Myxococcales bacterium]